MEIFFYLILPLLLTLVIEIPIYFLFNKQSIKYLLVVYLMNIVLNVLMNCYLLFVFGATSAYVDALIEAAQSVEDFDAYLERFAGMAQQPVVMH